VLLSGRHYVLPFSVPYAYYVITLHVRVGLSVCVESSSLLCIADVVWSCLVGTFLVVLRWGRVGESLFLGWSGVGGGWEVGLLLLSFVQDKARNVEISTPRARAMHIV